jgi:hypothetical protein
MPCRLQRGVAVAEGENGTFFSPLSSFKKHEQRLARYQRAMSRKIKFSNNWKKAKARIEDSRPHWQCAAGLPAQMLDHDQQKPRFCLYRGFTGEEYVPLGLWHEGRTGEECPGEVRAEQIHPRSGLV